MKQLTKLDVEEIYKKRVRPREGVPYLRIQEGREEVVKFKDGEIFFIDAGEQDLNKRRARYSTFQAYVWHREEGREKLKVMVLQEPLIAELIRLFKSRGIDFDDRDAWKEKPIVIKRLNTFEFKAEFLEDQHTQELRKAKDKIIKMAEECAGLTPDQLASAVIVTSENLTDKDKPALIAMIKEMIKTGELKRDLIDLSEEE